MFYYLDLVSNKQLLHYTIINNKLTIYTNETQN
jgi:hypothetical protein